MNNRFYYTFNECFDERWSGYTLNPDDQQTVKGWYQQLREANTQVEQYGNPSWIDNQNDTIKTLCKYYIYPRMIKPNVYFHISTTEHDISTHAKWKTTLGPEIVPRGLSFIQKIFLTKDRYEKLIELQQANINNIIADIETKTTSDTTSSNTNISNNTGSVRKNDTPSSFGNYSANNYTSEIDQTTSDTSDTYNGTVGTVVVSKTSLGSLADKLEIAERALTDYYERWADEVCKDFIILDI